MNRFSVTTIRFRRAGFTILDILSMPEMINPEGRGNKNPLQSALCGANLGTHRFQRAGVAGCALKSNWATRRDCALEAARTQGDFPISSRASFRVVDCIRV
jgi:hypothetical protein